MAKNIKICRFWRDRFRKKYFYVTLQEKDGENEEIIGFGLNGALRKMGKERKFLMMVTFLNENEKIIKKMGEEF